jgi:hypothetical protein
MMRPGWMDVLRIAGWVICSGILPACGNSEPPPVAKLVRPLQSDMIPRAEGEKIEAARLAASRGSLKCPFPEECAPSVALVSVVTEEGLDRCSGVLISEDRLLTNEHCVRGVGGTCEGAIFVHFAGIDGMPEQHAGCRKIERRSSPPTAGSMGMDFAVLRLDRAFPARGKAPLSEREPQNREPMRIIRVQMQGGKGGPYDGAQESIRCDIARGPYSYPGLDSGRFDLMALGDCAIQPGNSGSPVFDQKGELLGVVQGYLRLSDEESAKPGFRELLLDESFGQTGIGTRISCIPGVLRESEEGVESRCVKAPALSGRAPRDFLEQDATAEAPQLPEAPEGLQWREIESALLLERRFARAPVCAREQPRIRLQTLRYHKGINRELCAEWRAEGESFERDFEVDSAQSRKRHVSADGWSFELPACR